MSTIEPLGLRRAAIVLGHGTVDGPATLAPDEDAFTMVASALEAATAGWGRPDAPVRLVAGRGVPPDGDDTLPVLLGVPLEVVRPGPGAGLLRLFEEARREPERESVVVSVADPASEAAAAAFRLGPDTNHRLGTIDGSTVGVDARPGPRDDLEVARALHRLSVEAGVSSRWVGPWERPAGRPRRPGELQTPDPNEAERLRESVSQGAYVPRARYLENLPSRWRFAAERCAACGTTTFPTRGRCRSCRRTDRLEPVDLPREDLPVVATTVIGRGAQPTEFDAQVETRGPYAVLLAELAPSVRVTLQGTDAPPHAFRIGDRIDTRLRRLYPMDGAWRYGRKAVVREPVGRPEKSSPR